MARGPGTVLLRMYCRACGMGRALLCTAGAWSGDSAITYVLQGMWYGESTIVYCRAHGLGTVLLRVYCRACGMGRALLCTAGRMVCGQHDMHIIHFILYIFLSSYNSFPAKFLPLYSSICVFFILGISIKYSTCFLYGRVKAVIHSPGMSTGLYLDNDAMPLAP